MTAAYLMAWEPTRRRWWKPYRNRWYVVSWRQLGAPETKEGSYQAANAWWLAKRAEVDGRPQPAEHQLLLNDLALRRDGMSKNGDGAALLRKTKMSPESGSPWVLE